MSKLFPYREETDQKLIQAAAKAYEEAPPAHNTRTTLFGWAVGNRSASTTGVPRGDHAEAA
jgi:hypothetical protein